MVATTVHVTVLVCGEGRYAFTDRFGTSTVFPCFEALDYALTLLYRNNYVVVGHRNVVAGETAV